MKYHTEARRHEEPLRDLRCRLRRAMSPSRAIPPAQRAKAAGSGMFPVTAILSKISCAPISSSIVNRKSNMARLNLYNRSSSFAALRSHKIVPFPLSRNSSCCAMCPVRPLRLYQLPAGHPNYYAQRRGVTGRGRPSELITTDWFTPD